MKSKTGKAALVVLCAVFLSACAGVDTTPIEKDMARAEESIKGARRSGAETHTLMQLNQAEEKLEKARAAFEDEEYEEAGWLAEEALVCANLAEAQTRSAKIQETVRELRETIQTLEKEIKRQRME